MIKVFAYLRVSGKAQVAGDGFPRQLKAIRDHSDRSGLKIVRVFREEGVSGAKESLDRPAFIEMMAMLGSAGIRTVVIERLDRLARDLMIQETIIADFRKRGLEIISTAEPDLLCDDPTRKLMRQLLGAVAEYEKNMIVSKLRVARARVKVNEGRCEGNKPFGFYAGEDAALRRMRELRTTGMGFDRIAATLNAEGIPTRRGRQWWGLTVNQILTGKTKRRHA